MLKDPIPEPGSPEYEIWRKQHPPPPPPSVVIGIYSFLYVVIAAGYVLYRLGRASFEWAVVNNYIYGVAGVLVLICFGSLGLWVYSAHRRLFGAAEMLFAMILAFFFTQRIFFATLAVAPFESIFECVGAMFSFVQGARHARRNHGA